MVEKWKIIKTKLRRSELFFIHYSYVRPYGTFFGVCFHSYQKVVPTGLNSSVGAVLW